MAGQVLLSCFCQYFPGGYVVVVYIVLSVVLLLSFVLFVSTVVTVEVVVLLWFSRGCRSLFLFAFVRLLLFFFCQLFSLLLMPPLTYVAF